MTLTVVSRNIILREDGLDVRAAILIYWHCTRHHPIMATVAINVTYGFQTKKINIPKSHTVGQLATQAATAFNLTGEPSLEYKGKRLDQSLPLRFTQLLQNSNVKLNIDSTATLAPSTIVIKVATPKTSTVIKTTNDVTIEGVLKLAETNLQTSII